MTVVGKSWNYEFNPYSNNEIWYKTFGIFFLNRQIYMTIASCTPQSSQVSACGRWLSFMHSFCFHKIFNLTI